MDEGMNPVDKDALLVQFLTMTEDRVDPEVATSLLDASGWDIQRAVDMVFDSGASSQPPPAMPPAAGPGTGRGAADADFFDVDDPRDTGIGMDGWPRDTGFSPGETPGAMAPGQAPGRGPGLGPGMAPDFDVRMPDRDVPGANGGALHGGQLGGMDDGDMDAQLAAAIEQSYHAQTPGGFEQNEQDMIEQALRMSKEDAQRRERADLRDQQEAELRESEFMDQMREVRESEEVADAERARQASEASMRDETAREDRQREDKAQNLAQKRARIAVEPAEGAADRRMLMFRFPGGASKKRAFLGSSLVRELYDFIDVECEGEDWADKPYKVISTMPKRYFEERDKSLAEAGIEKMSALVVEVPA